MIVAAAADDSIVGSRINLIEEAAANHFIRGKSSEAVRLPAADETKGTADGIGGGLADAKAVGRAAARNGGSDAARADEIVGAAGDQIWRAAGIRFNAHRSHGI